jgi:hypothetical protein
MRRIFKRLLGIALTLTAMLSLTTGGDLVGAVSPAIVGACPTAINGYLPINVYATGISWGDIYTDGDVATGSAEKFIRGYESVGVTCGILGGYIQFDMGVTPIINDANNEYGVDFIVYGNVLSSGKNAEPGIVMVAADANNDDIPDAWYELAGSLYYYYDDPIPERNTLHNQTVAYINVLVPDDKFPLDGVYCSFNYTGDIDAATWTPDVASPTWWPEYEIEPTPTPTPTPTSDPTPTPTPIPYYKRVVELDPGTVTAQGGGAYVNWEHIYSPDDPDTLIYEIITYRDITILSQDFVMQYDKIQFGYFDVTYNGISYGTPENPYEPYTTRTKGGDGYDLSWAVDANGNPVSLDKVRFVRLYSGVNSVGKIMDISAEVTGLYSVNGGGSSTLPTPMVILRQNGAIVSLPSSGIVSSTQGYQQLTVSSGDVWTIASAAAYVYVNGVQVSAPTSSPYTLTLDLTSGQHQTIQVITQTSDRQAYIRTIDFVGA